VPVGTRIVTAAERPDLWASVDGIFASLWPEYNHHGDLTARYFGALLPTYAHLQFLLVDEETDEVVGRGRSIPFTWDGTAGDLAGGIDAVGLRGAEARHAPTALSALAAEVVPGQEGRGLGGAVLRAMAAGAKKAGLSPLLAPVRPSEKHLVPLVPIEDYATRRRPGDDLLADPWLRTHERLGARIVRPEPHSLRITAPVADWERWTGVTFDAEGPQVFPLGLAPLEVRDGIGRYYEPNVWMLHEV